MNTEHKNEVILYLWRHPETTWVSVNDIAPSTGPETISKARGNLEAETLHEVLKIVWF